MITPRQAAIELARRKAAREAAKAKIYSPHEPTSKQKAFVEYEGLEAMYGGAAGGGKSDALLMSALRFVHIPGYAALILRRTFTDLALPGAIMDRSHDWLDNTDAQWDAQNKCWRFPSGATLTFGFLENAGDEKRYQSAEFQFCVAKGTLIVMADGSTKPVEDVCHGDMVSTLIGPRPVTKTHKPKRKQCFEVVSGNKKLVASEDHKLLTDCGWVSLRELTSIESRSSHNTHESSAAKSLVRAPHDECSCCDPPPLLEPCAQIHHQSQHLAIDAAKATQEIDCAACPSIHQEDLQLRPLSVRLVLSGRHPQTEEVKTSSGNLRSAQHRGPSETSPQGFQPGYRDECDLCDEQPRHRPVACQEYIPSLSDAGDSNPMRSNSDGLASIHGRTQRGRYTYRHPYTNAPQSTDDVHLAFASMRPVGELEVYDLTVGEASHYLTYGGFISCNCGFDELTQFARPQYTFMFSRLRKTGIDVPLRMRSATNPGGIGHAWVKDRWAITDDVDMDKVHVGPDRVFFPAKLDDNPHIDRASYELSLAQLEFVTREQLRKGSWRQDASGLVYAFDYERDCIEELPQLPAGMSWHNILGIDYGNINATALVVLRYCIQFSDVVFVAESQKWEGLTPSAAAEVVQSWSKRYGGFVSMVGDTGGLGKGYVEEARQRFALPIEPAEKQNKYGYVKLINGAFQGEKIKVVRSMNESLIKELNEHPWKNGKQYLEEQPGSANHAVDSMLYSWRAAVAWAHRAAPSRGPTPGTNDYYDNEAKRLREAAEREADHDPFSIDPIF